MKKSLAVTAAATASVAAVGIIDIDANFVSQVMNGSFNWAGTIKWGAIFTAIGLGLYFLLNNGVFANENLEEGERGYRRRWGKIISSKKRGRKLLLPGKKHFYIKHWYDVTVQSVRTRSTPEQPNYDKPVRATYQGVNILYVLVVKWRVIDEEQAIYKSLTRIYQVNRASEGNDALENYIMNEVHRVIGRSLSKFDANENSLPVITLDGDESAVPQEVTALCSELEQNYGVSLEDISAVLLAVAPEAGMRLT